MRRVVWMAFGLGLGVGLVVLVSRRLDQASKALSPSGVASSLKRVVNQASELAGEIRQTTNQRHQELRGVLLHGEEPK